MIKVFCYSRCTTCKKALKWLDEKGIEHEVIDIKEDHPDETTLREYYAVSGLPLKRFFNTSGMQYRELGLSKKLSGKRSWYRSRLHMQRLAGSGFRGVILN